MAGPGPTTANRDSLYEGRILAAQSERFEPRTDGSLATLGAGVPPAPTRPTTPGGAPALASPGLTVLAATGIMEGYRQFHLIPSAHLRLSNYAFAVIAPLVAVLLARSRRGWYRNDGPAVAVGGGAPDRPGHPAGPGRGAVPVRAPAGRPRPGRGGLRTLGRTGRRADGPVVPTG